ncbi:cell division protein ZapD [Zophobihabitans entericus]|uniref:Cell division protein ZapD n=1 Tax=Zophobihabitans entericus TaxID=1635327 RepID=A0A6G9IDQ4_9GAMM|nr:cell division protein ZapD [Zophobihabitans entericus]QIQ21834.1 cell division protein ZapD [Zophobihabitans entericus]
MSDSLPKIIFEHPLSEKMRTWLRIEFLIKQIYTNKIFNQDNALLFFHTLSELLEIVERSDVRSDLLKELEIQKQKLAVWSNVDGVDVALLHSLLDKLSALSIQLNTNPRLGQELKEDRFLSSIRQRLMIPGGCCSFDLPSFYLWLHLPQSERDTQVLNWISCFSSLHDALAICMQLIRQTSIFKPYQCNSNFYQDNNEEAELLRIRVPLEPRVFPQVSGAKSRYAIRFLPFKTGEQEQRCAFQFELACC